MSWNDLAKIELKGNNVLALIAIGNDLEYLNILLNLIESEREKYSDVLVIDLNPILRNHDTFNRFFLKIAGLNSPEKEIFYNNKNLSFKIISPPDGYTAFKNADIDNVTLQTLNDAVLSTYISSFGFTKIKKNFKSKRFVNRCLREAENIYVFVNNLLGQSNVKTIMVPNGRFHSQRSVIEAAKNNLVQVQCYERGSYEFDIPFFAYNAERYYISYNYWLEEFPPNSLVKKQFAISKLNQKLILPHLPKAKNWLKQREEIDGTNFFTRYWTNKENLNFDKLAVLFHSSEDEFAVLKLLDIEEEENYWESQWEAFAFVIKEMESRGYSVVLRLHPNLKNKPPSTQREAKIKVQDLLTKSKSLVVLESDSIVNSYELCELSEVVVVWNSTIGLEASAKGKKVICLTNAAYDLIADVLRWRNKNSVSVDSLMDWKVDCGKALNYIAARYVFDRPCMPLLHSSGLNAAQYLNRIALISNTWALRNNNRLNNLISVFLRRETFLKTKTN